MARNLNYVFLRGRIGGDLELKQTKNGKDYVRFSIANNQDYGDSERTNWFDCVVWGPLAGLMVKMVGKGSDIIVEGNLSQNTYEVDGKKMSRVEVIVTKAEFITYKKDASTASTKQTFTPQEQEYEEYDMYDPDEEF